MNIVQLIDLINNALIRDYGFVANYATVEEYKAHSGIDISLCARATEIIQAVFVGYYGDTTDV